MTRDEASDMIPDEIIVRASWSRHEAKKVRILRALSEECITWLEFFDIMVSLVLRGGGTFPELQEFLQEAQVLLDAFQEGPINYEKFLAKLFGGAQTFKDLSDPKFFERHEEFKRYQEMANFYKRVGKVREGD